MKGSVFMHWAEETARKIIEVHPNKDLYTVASGISPSGNVHIGNFREVATTYFVARELRNLGVEVRFIFSWDDFDRFRKVPEGVGEDLSRYLGMPYSNVPFQGSTYADYFEKQFERELSELGIEVEFLYQTKRYQSGIYDEYITLALDNRREIFDIITSFKTQQFSNDERESFYPINLYCERCQKDSTVIESYDGLTLSYRCGCGHSSNQVVSGRNVKLNWKVDWPMRWMFEDVVFEPGGRDHSSATGSFNVSKEISSTIFNYQAPIYIPYDFIGVKGGTTKISSSSGNTIVLSDLLEVFNKEIILWLYGKYRNNVPFNIGLDDDVLRYYSEYDRFANAVFRKNISDDNIISVMNLSGCQKEYSGNVSFSTLVTFLPIVGNDVILLKELLKKDGQEIHHPRLNLRIIRAQKWLEKYGSSRQLNLLEEFNDEVYSQLTKVQRNWIYKTYELIKFRRFDNAAELQSELYAIPKMLECSLLDLKARQKEFFRILYNLFFGTNKGPKLSLVILAFNSEDLLRLLKEL